jgi:hypothetical protein
MVAVDSRALRPLGTASVVLVHDEGKEYEVATKTGRLIYPKKKPLTKRVSSSPHGS